MSATKFGTLNYSDNMAELRYRAGNVKDPGVHKIGIIALGSHLENHGPALPIDTDAKIGAHIAFQASLETGAKFLNIEKVVIVNAHGGNIPLMAELWEIEDKTDLAIVFNNKVISSEGPHGGSGELSMAKVLGIINENEIENQANVNEYEEIGLYGFKKARENDPNIEEGARDIEENGVYVDEDYGKRLFNLAINSVLLDVEKLLDF